jgi:class 3 adenylate cyclase
MAKSKLVDTFQSHGYFSDFKSVSRISDKVETLRKVVVCVDICSSTTILEDLLRTDNQVRWRNLLILLKQFLSAEAKKQSFLVYKFIGDGWILLFDEEITDGTALVEFMRRICIRYAEIFFRRVRPALESEHKVGLTFGVDSGRLVRIEMNGQDEYIGRPLNVAARLQAAAKANDKYHDGKILISKPAYAKLRMGKLEINRGKIVELKLRNIVGGDGYLARKILVWKAQ